MNKETLSRAKELEADIKCIEALLAEHKKNHWLIVTSPRPCTEGQSGRFQEELAWILMCPYDTAGEPEEIMPCVRDGAGPDFTPPSRCLQCTVEWLKKRSDIP